MFGFYLCLPHIQKKQTHVSTMPNTCCYNTKHTWWSSVSANHIFSCLGEYSFTSTCSLLHTPTLRVENLPLSSRSSTLVLFTIARWTSSEREGLWEELGCDEERREEIVTPGGWEGEGGRDGGREGGREGEGGNKLTLW